MDRFEKDCGKESFHVPDDVENGFCKASDVSVSAMFMVGGAFACECDADGSLDHYNYNSFGGQCQC